MYLEKDLNSYNTILLNNNSVSNTGGLFLNMTNHSGSGIVINRIRNNYCY